MTGNENSGWSKGLTVAAGITAGIVMALILLKMMIASDFSMKSFGFIAVLVFAAAAVHCIGFLEKLSVSVKAAKLIMTAVSLAVTILYAFVVFRGEYAGTMTTMLGMTLAAHLAAAVSVFLFSGKQS